jgi:hypothetical protein
MICFTDTPIEQSLEHCKNYGLFGISFNKESLIEYGANPVFYFTDARAKIIEFVQGLRNFSDEESQFKYSTLTSYFQPYNSKKKEFAEFNEREWRINRLLPFPYVVKNNTYNEYKFEGEIRREEIEKEGRPDHNFYLKFDKRIIENIVVPVEYQDEITILLNTLDIHCDVFIIER